LLTASVIICLAGEVMPGDWNSPTFPAIHPGAQDITGDGDSLFVPDVRLQREQEAGCLRFQQLCQFG
jgi:hypothetical protein